MRIAAVAVALLAFTCAGSVQAEPAQGKAPKAKAPAHAAQPAPHPAPAPKAEAKPEKPNLFTLAVKGDARAQYELGVAYKTGHGARPDAREALWWFSMAGIDGIKEGAVEAAEAYEQGRGTKRDLQEAARWWARAGELGDAEARRKALDLYLSGQVSHAGSPSVAKWLEPAAAEGDTRAALALGQLYESGDLVAANPAKAEYWYREAAYAGDVEARYRLGRLLLSRPGELRAVVLSDADKEKLSQHRLLGAMAGRDGADNKSFVRPGMVQGQLWLERAAAQNHAGASLTLGEAMAGGLDLPLDLVHGVAYLQAAANMGEADAFVDLGDLVAKGQGVHGKDPVRAWVDYDLAAGLGRKDAADARERLAKSMNPKQLGRARQLAQEVRDIKGL
jgi:hypothetical protein